VSNSQSTKTLIRYVSSLSIAGMALIKQTHNSACVLRFVRPNDSCGPAIVAAQCPSHPAFLCERLEMAMGTRDPIPGGYLLH
jgi:hypothetical protein